MLLLSIAAKLWLCLFYRKLGKSIRSEALLASAADSRNDVASTAAVLAAYAFAYFTHIQIDGWAGLLVAVFILWSGVGIAKDTIDPLLGEAPDEALVHAIAQEIRSYDARVLGIHDLIVHDYGPGRRFASVHVELDAREDVLEAHELIDNIERDVTKKLRVELVIHYDPIVTDDAEVNEVRQRVEAIVTEIDPRLSFHDFRMVRGREHSNVIFDLVLPFDLRGQEHALRARIGAALHAENPRYRAVITFDSEAFNDVHTRMEADIPEAGDMPAKKAGSPVNMHETCIAQYKYSVQQTDFLKTPLTSCRRRGRMSPNLRKGDAPHEDHPHRCNDGHDDVHADVHVHAFAYPKRFVFSHVHVILRGF